MNDYRDIINIIPRTLVAISALLVAARYYTSARIMTTDLGGDDQCMLTRFIVVLQTFPIQAKLPTRYSPYNESARFPSPLAPRVNLGSSEDKSRVLRDFTAVDATGRVLRNVR